MIVRKEKASKLYLEFLRFLKYNAAILLWYITTQYAIYNYFCQLDPPFWAIFNSCSKKIYSETIAKHLVVTKTKSQLVTVGTTVEESTPQ